jgi:Rrf2 family protein
MLKFSKRADYALLSLQYMATVQSSIEANLRVVNTKEIAEEHNIPVELLAKVLQTLARHQLIESHHNGPKGGYALGRDPKDITLAQVLEVIEGPLGLTDCCHEKNGQSQCEQMNHCNIRTPLLKIQESIYQLLNGMSIEDLLVEEPPMIFVESLKPQGVPS